MIIHNENEYENENRSHKYDKDKDRNIVNIKCLSMMMLICTNQHLSNI